MILHSEICTENDFVPILFVVFLTNKPNKGWFVSNKTNPPKTVKPDNNECLFDSSPDWTCN